MSSRNDPECPKRIVISDELLRRKEFDGSTLTNSEQASYVDKWMEEHADILVNQLGSKNDGLSFLNGMFFVPSFAKTTVPFLKDMFMADACHLQFGKYTLFSCYGITANANMSPVAFAILFGNENGTAWKQFWEFCVDTHPMMNRAQVTIVTDQDKGQMNAIARHMNLAGHFHCSWHRRQNIIKKCGGGGGRTPYSALWMYNKLIQCRTVEQLELVKEQNFTKMHTSDHTYLNKLADVSQYPAARCAMGEGIYMYHRTSSAAVESMNAANKEIRDRTAVDLVNATILLLRLECTRFNKMKDLAWRSDNALTPRGEIEFAEVYNDVNFRDFLLLHQEKTDQYEFTVTRRCQPTKVFNVVIPKEATDGSYFGRCTCGVDTRDGVPCDHMAAIVKSSRIPSLTKLNMMPSWWTRKRWQLQFPLEHEAVCVVSLENIKATTNRDKLIKYCPSWSAPNKPGRPKKNERRKSGIEIAMGKRGAKKPKRLRLYCQICGKHNHMSSDCWKDPKNASKRPNSWKSAEELMLEIGMGDDDNVVVTQDDHLAGDDVEEGHA
jgi:hypothetical protein